MKRNLISQTFLVLSAVALASCGGKASSSSTIASISSADALTVLDSAFAAYLSHDSLGFNFSRHPDTIKTGKQSNDFSLTYTPVEKQTTPTSSTSETSTSGSALLADASVTSSSSQALDLTSPVTIGISGFASDDFPAKCYVNGLSDSVGNGLLGYFYLDYPTFSFTQGDNSPTRLSETALTTYLDINALYLDLSKISFVSSITSAVQQIPGNESWEFPSGKRGKVALPSKASSAISYFLPLQQYLPSLGTAVVQSLKNDEKGTKSLGLAFSQNEDGITMTSTISSFSKFYSLLVEWTKSMVATKGTLLEQAAEYALIDDSVLKPIQKYGNCLSSFSLSLSLTYRATGLDKASFILDGAADLDKLKTSYADSDVSGFVTAFHGAGVLDFVVDADAAIPTPSPALSTYPEIPAIVYNPA
jgi:hypothetical protein